MAQNGFDYDSQNLRSKSYGQVAQAPEHFVASMPYVVPATTANIRNISQDSKTPDNQFSGAGVYSLFSEETLSQKNRIPDALTESARDPSEINFTSDIFKLGGDTARSDSPSPIKVETRTAEPANNSSTVYAPGGASYTAQQTYQPANQPKGVMADSTTADAAPADDTKFVAGDSSRQPAPRTLKGNIFTVNGLPVTADRPRSLYFDAALGYSNDSTYTSPFPKDSKSVQQLSNFVSDVSVSQIPKIRNNPKQNI